MSGIGGDTPRAGARVWMDAARPRTLGASVAPVLMAGAMAAADGGFHGGIFCCTLVCAVLIQIAANYANDYYDCMKGADTAERLGPVRATAAGLVTPAQMRRATGLVLALALVLGFFLVLRGGWPILLIGVLSLIFAVLYTGGPFPLGYLGLGDIFVLIFFGPVAVAGAHYAQTLHWSGLAVLAGLAPGLFSTAILAVNNLRDVDEDRRTGKKTLAVRFGSGFAKKEHAVCIVAAALIVPLLACLLAGGHWFAMVGALALLPGLRSIRAVHTVTGRVLNAELAATGKTLLIFSMLFSAGWLL